ncbi:MAG: tyrosine-type recombinase/integrase [Anaerolineales bacterium]
MLFVDSGIRCSELCILNWGDVNPETGELRVRAGKGQKDRTTGIGAQTMRALLRYRRTIKPLPTAKTPLILGRGGKRLTPCWLSHLVKHLGAKVGCLQLLTLYGGHSLSCR